MRARFVYFIRPVGALGPIKIGSTACIERRVRAYQICSPVPLELAVAVPGDFKLEHRLHDCFLDAHLHHEWFRPVPALLAGIDKLRAGQSAEQAFDLSAVVGNHRLHVHYANRRKRAAEPAFA